MSLKYRAVQFLRSITARISPQGRSAVEDILSPELSVLFFRMQIADQAHSLRVLHELLERGEQDADLLAATLLHDVGKIQCKLTPFERAAIVLANHVSPELVIRLGKGPARGLLRAFSTAIQHPAWGAAMVEANGGTPRLCALIRFHQEPAAGVEESELQSLLVRLQQADNRH
jgi:hypothetical protein